MIILYSKLFDSFLTDFNENQIIKVVCPTSDQENVKYG